jgi:hypothetical protein
MNLKQNSEKYVIINPKDKKILYFNYFYFKKIIFITHTYEDSQKSSTKIISIKKFDRTLN